MLLKQSRPLPYRPGMKRLFCAVLLSGLLLSAGGAFADNLDELAAAARRAAGLDASWYLESILEMDYGASCTFIHGSPDPLKNDGVISLQYDAGAGSVRVTYKCLPRP